MSLISSEKMVAEKRLQTRGWIFYGK